MSSDEIYVYCSYINQTAVYIDLCNAGSQEQNPSLNPAHITTIMYNHVIQMYTLEPKCTLSIQERGWQNIYLKGKHWIYTTVELMLDTFSW